MKKNRWKMKFIIIMLLTGMIWCPLTMVWCVGHPDLTLIYTTRLGFCAWRAKTDMIKTIDRHTPKQIKKFKRKADKVYTRYGFRDAHNLVVNVAPFQLGYEPKPSVFVRVTSGVVGLINKAVSFLI